MKRTIRLSESELKNMISESVRRVLNEVADDTTTLSRLFRNVRAQDGVVPSSYNFLDNGYNTRRLSKAQQRIKDKIGPEDWAKRRHDFLDDIKKKHDTLVGQYDDIIQDFTNKLTAKYDNREDTEIFNYNDTIYVDTASDDVVKEISKECAPLGLSIQPSNSKAFVNGLELKGYLVRPTKNKRTIA